MMLKKWVIMAGKIGFCCKYIADNSEINGISPKSPSRKYNCRSITKKWLNDNPDIAIQKMMDVVAHNVNSVYNLIDIVSQSPEYKKMVRISSDVLPLYTAPEWVDFYKRDDVVEIIKKVLCASGDLARRHNIRLSFHPGQFCVLASENPGIVDNSLAEFEYHTDLARFMGYGVGWHDHGFKINIHISGRGGVKKFRESFDRLSPAAKNLITVENEEITYGLSHVLEVADICPIVLDIHHHWLSTGEYIWPEDSRFKDVVSSWRGVTPVIHYSVSRSAVLKNHNPDILPDLVSLKSQGFNIMQLRAHSDFYWNRAVNEWARMYLTYADIQCEAKAKNLALGWL